MNWILTNAAGARRPRQAALLCMLCAVAALSAGCATTHVITRLTTGHWMETTDSDTIDWINGEPVHKVDIEARLTTPPRALCRQSRDEPAALINSVKVQFSQGIRVWTGVIAAMELLLGSAPILLAADGDTGGAEIAIASFFAVDGLSAIVLAAAVPRKYRPSLEDRQERHYLTELCPAGLAFELGMERFPVMSNGEVTPEAATYIMREVVETGMPIGLRYGDTFTTIEVSLETRCEWATHLNHRSERALCPPVPSVIQVPVAVPMSRGRAPARR